MPAELFVSPVGLHTARAGITTTATSAGRRSQRARAAMLTSARHGSPPTTSTPGSVRTASTISRSDLAGSSWTHRIARPRGPRPRKTGIDPVGSRLCSVFGPGFLDGATVESGMAVRACLLPCRSRRPSSACCAILVMVHERARCGEHAAIAAHRPCRRQGSPAN